MRRPDFFIAGAPKCGTTSFDIYLARHPQIFMSPVKETHFFATDFRYGRKYRRFTPGEYSALFAGAGAAERVGETSVFYLYSVAAPHNVKAYCRAARVIVMLRDPIEMLRSLHSQFLYTCDENLSDLEAALNEEPRRKRERIASGTVGFAEMLFYRDVVAVWPQLARWIDVFGRENVHVILYDDLKRDARGVYRSALRFLGVREDFEPEFEVLNAHKVLRSRIVGKFLMNHLPRVGPRVRAMVRSVLPTHARHRLYGLAARLNTRQEAMPPMPAGLRRRLASELRPDVDRLERLIDRDLGTWCRADETAQ
jgi:hypothetical protein